jgi:hypothetical protein
LAGRDLRQTVPVVGPEAVMIMRGTKTKKESGTPKGAVP